MFVLETQCLGCGQSTQISNKSFSLATLHFELNYYWTINGNKTSTVHVSFGPLQFKRGSYR